MTENSANVNKPQGTLVSPQGTLVLQTVAMPTDTNANGDIFGGWLVSQMDLGGAVLATRSANNRVATVAIDQMSFIKPVFIGDLVSSFASIVRTGRSSITILVEVWSRRQRQEIFEQVAK